MYQLTSDLYPFKSHFATINGHRLHYVDEGEGHPILMVHGNPSWSFYYRDLIKELRGRYRVIALDHIGMGLSDKPADAGYPYTLERRVNDLEAFIDAVGLERFTLVGHDWGGIISTCYASMHPDRIQSMTMLNTAGFWWPANKRLPLALFSARIPYLSAPFIRGANVFAEGAVRIGMKRRQMSKEVADGFLHPYQSWSDRRAVHRFIQDIPVKATDPGAELVMLTESRLGLLQDTPLFLGWGMKDFIFCDKILDEWIRHFPNAEVHRVPDGGHYILEDAPEIMIPKITEFIDRNAPNDLDTNAKTNTSSATSGNSEHGDRTPDRTPDRTMVGRIAELAQSQPDEPMVIHQTGMDGDVFLYEKMTFAEADADSNRIAHGLAKIGVTPGMHTVLMVTPGKDFFSLLAAIFKLGAIPVFVDPGMGLRNLKRSIEETEPEAFIGIPRAHAGRVAMGWAKKTIRINVTVGARVPAGGYTLDSVRAMGSDAPVLGEPKRENSTEMIAFTSGNTGPPKGVIYTSSIFPAILDRLQEILAPVSGDVDLSTFPPFALMGPGMGMTSTIPDMDASKPGSADPAKLVAAIADQKCTTLFVSPALIEKLGRYCEENGVKLPTLRMVLSAGAPARVDSLARFTRALNEDVEVTIPYGATEALPITIIGSRELLEETADVTRNGGGVCVGRPVRDVDVAVIAIDEEAIVEWSEDLRLPIGEIGEIVVKGPVVTPAYYNRPEQNRLAKIADPDGGPWHRMGDVGYLDEQGRVWMCGRKGHRVETGTATLFSLPTEAVFDQHPCVVRSALVGVPANGSVEPVVVVELNDEGDTTPSVVGEILALGLRYEHTQAVSRILQYRGPLPTDVRHNAKINREKLALWAQKEMR